MSHKKRGYRRPLAGLGWERLDPSYVDQPGVVRKPLAGGRPGPELRRLIDQLAGYGFTVLEISRLAGVRPATIFRHFREEMTTSSLRLDKEVIEAAFHQAVGGPDRDWRRADASMTRFWLGHRLGWKQPTAYDKVAKADLDLDRLSDDELNELDRLLSQAGDEGSGEGGA